MQSTPGKGTTFSVFLPISAASSATVVPEKPENIPTGKERILLVDDEAPLVHMGKLTLERLGYRVVTCNGSIEALAVFKAAPDAFDLVLTDMTMPHMTGDQLSREILAVRPDMPIIICTGFSERANQEKADALGVKGFLLKPISRSDLARMLRTVLDESKPPADA